MVKYTNKRIFFLDIPSHVVRGVTKLRYNSLDDLFIQSNLLFKSRALKRLGIVERLFVCWIYLHDVVHDIEVVVDWIST